MDFSCKEKCKAYIIFLGTNAVDSKTIIWENNHANSLYGYFNEFTSILEALELLLGSFK
jgi:hypothetical protein